MIAAALFPLCAYAHSGGTDSKGGHYNRSTGEYHYHHGYSAHQHKDMDGDGKLDCPYEFDDKDYYSEIPKVTIDPNLLKEMEEWHEKAQEYTTPKDIKPLSSNTKSATTASYKSTESRNNSTDGILTFLLITTVVEAVVIIGFAFSCRNKNYEIDSIKRKHSQEMIALEKEFNEKTAEMVDGVKELAELESKIKTTHGNLIDLICQINSKKDALQFWEAEKQKAKLEVDKIRESGIEEKEKAMLDIARIRNIPLGVSIAKDGYPIYWEPSQNKPYGDYTVFYNSKAKVFHTDYSCAPFFATETHLFKVIPEGRPCKKCAKKFEGFVVPYWFSNPK